MYDCIVVGAGSAGYATGRSGSGGRDLRDPHSRPFKSRRGRDLDTEAGTVWFNDRHAGSPTNPFGGYKRIGIGRDTRAEYTRVKAPQEAGDSDSSRCGHLPVLPPPA